MLAVGDAVQRILVGFPWMEPDYVRACLVYAARAVRNGCLGPALTEVEP
jgi:uncharacterized protein (DUF433 family)